MKVHELFNEVGFVSIIQPLVRIDHKNRQGLDAFKKAYDILVSMVPEETDEVLVIEWMQQEKYGAYLKVRNCEGDSWEKNLGKEIVLGPGVILDAEELAARILWSLTFYGINLKEQGEFAKNLQLCHYLSDCNPIFAATNK